MSGSPVATLTEQTSNTIARPLKVLVPLIREDLRRAEAAATEAAMPHHLAAGEKMLEARGQMSHGDFGPWLKREFKIGSTQAYRYMAAVEAQENFRPRKFSSVNEALKASGRYGYMPNKPRPQPWHDPVKQIINRVDVERLATESLRRAEEQRLQYKLALQLIDIGYKALAAKLHPDKGGSHAAMARLNMVRNRLKDTAR
jgi:hypothetical protein